MLRRREGARFSGVFSAQGVRNGKAYSPVPHTRSGGFSGCRRAVEALLVAPRGVPRFFGRHRALLTRQDHFQVTLDVEADTLFDSYDFIQNLQSVAAHCIFGRL